MEVREFCENILSAKTLAEKLASFSDLSDENRKTKYIPSLPNRPKKLEFSSAKPPKFPSLEELHKSDKRGLVFHFFANHELLALELMAHTLLRFPNAPTEFRRGLAYIMQEEQNHLKLYIDRMAESGFEFGDFPVNDYFWRLISPVQSLEKFTAYMSLSFEQANLDFSLYYLKAFAKLGDSASRQTLQTVYDDELGHVEHGLKWANKWKPAEQSLWNFYTKELEFPMTARRAKGKVYYPEARQAAGFDQDFIDKLKLFSHSKGKTPIVFEFNGLAEYDMQKQILAPKYRSLTKDLESLPIFLASADDIVLSENTFSDEFLNHLQAANIPLPELLQKNNLESLKDRKLHHFEPWAKNALAINTWEKQRFICSENTQAIGVDYFKKSFSANLLKDFLNNSDLANLAPIESVGKKVESIAELCKLAAEMAKPFLIKADLASAGNQFRLVENNTDNYEKWLKTQFQSQEALLLEPWLERVLDFSIQFLRDKNGLVRSKGIAIMENSRLGKFKGLKLGPLNKILDPELLEFLFQPLSNSNLIQLLQNEFCNFLTANLANSPLRGAFGIDCFVYRNSEDKLMIKPIVELNPRYTMGRVGLELRKCLQANATASWRIQTVSDLKKTGAKSFSEFAKDMIKKHPFEFKQDKLSAGFLATSDYTQAVDYFSYLLID